jgi:hypothetical protein
MKVTGFLTTQLQLLIPNSSAYAHHAGKRTKPAPPAGGPPEWIRRQYLRCRGRLMVRSRLGTPACFPRSGWHWTTLQEGGPCNRAARLSSRLCSIELHAHDQRIFKSLDSG